MTLPKPHPDIHFLPFLDGAALFHSTTQRLWVLNSTLAFIWCSLGECSKKDILVQGFAENFHIHQAQARQDINTALENLSTEGLFEGGEPHAITTGLAWQDLLSVQGPSPADEPAYSSQLVFPNIKVLLAISDLALLGEMLRMYEPFLDDDETGEDRQSASRPVLSIAILPADNAAESFDIYIDNRRFDTNVSRERIIPYLVTAIFQKVSKHLEDYLVFHSAALSQHGKTLIFPANSGAGKRTLCAALLMKGWDCLSDELTIIEPEDGLISPMPLPMSLKTGSIDPLRQDYPELSAYPLHQRADGKQVRYLPIRSSAALKLGERHTLSTIVIPDYSQLADTVFEPVDKALVLQKMAETGSSERPLTVEDLRGLICLIEKTPCYQLSYGSTEAASDLLGRFVYEAK